MKDCSDVDVTSGQVIKFWFIVGVFRFCFVVFVVVVLLCVCVFCFFVFVFVFNENAYVEVYRKLTDRQMKGRTDRRWRVSLYTHFFFAREQKGKKKIREPKFTRLYFEPEHSKF